MKKEKCDYSVEERLALLDEAEKFFEDYSYLDERLEYKWKPVKLMAALIKWEKDFEKTKDAYLHAVISFVQSLWLKWECKERVDAWLGLIIWIFQWEKKVIDSFRDTKEIVEEKVRLEAEQKEEEMRNYDEKEQEIADITAEIKIYFNKK